jgi:hypothetical protein
LQGGSSKKREANVDHDRETGQVRMYKDYFDMINQLYKEKEFCRRYRMIILNGVRGYDDYFEAKYDCTDKIDFSS